MLGSTVLLDKYRITIEDYIMNSKNITQQILTTRGISSKVLINGDVQKLKTIGHIGLFDFDGMPKKDILDMCMELDGINILWESSITGYHLWNLAVRSIEDIALMGLRLRCDEKHVAHGYRLNNWVLRITPKFRENETKYKPAPKLIHTWCNESTRHQSKPHLNCFIALTGKTILAKNDYEYLGLHAAIEDYMTMTDKMKKGLNRAKR